MLGCVIFVRLGQEPNTTYIMYRQQISFIIPCIYIFILFTASTSFAWSNVVVVTFTSLSLNPHASTNFKSFELFSNFQFISSMYLVYSSQLYRSYYTTLSRSLNNPTTTTTLFEFFKFIHHSLIYTYCTFSHSHSSLFCLSLINVKAEKKKLFFFKKSFIIFISLDFVCGVNSFYTSVIIHHIFGSEQQQT
jgi:hypothetical protein